MKTGIPTHINTEASYDWPCSALFMEKSGVFPSQFKLTGWYDTVRLLERLNYEYDINAKEKIVEYVEDKNGVSQCKEIFVTVEKNLFFHLQIVDGIEYEDDEEDDEMEEVLAVARSRAKKQRENKEKCYNIRFTVYYDEAAYTLLDIQNIVKITREYKIEEIYSRHSINIIYQDERVGLSIRPFNIEKPELNLELNYGKDFLSVHNIVFNRLEEKVNAKGIVLLYGQPGTGKTTYIRHLVNALKGKVLIYVPPSMVELISDPKFIPFWMRYSNAILIIEDGENAIKSRKSSSNQTVANLLNLADGLLSDCLNMQVVCTFNCDIGEVDEALLRKGRLIAKYEFKALEVEDAQKLSDSLGFKTQIVEPMSLTDIYNQKDRSFKEKKKSSIGFKKE